MVEARQRDSSLSDLASNTNRLAGTVSQQDGSRLPGFERQTDLRLRREALTLRQTRRRMLVAGEEDLLDNFGLARGEECPDGDLRKGVAVYEPAVFDLLSRVADPQAASLFDEGAELTYEGVSGRQRPGMVQEEGHVRGFEMPLDGFDPAGAVRWHFVDVELLAFVKHLENGLKPRDHPQATRLGRLPLKLRTQGSLERLLLRVAQLVDGIRSVRRVPSGPVVDARFRELGETSLLFRRDVRSEADAPFPVLKSDDVAREQEVLPPVFPPEYAHSGRVPGKEERFEVRTELQPLVTELFCGTLRLRAHSRALGFVMAELAAEPVVELLVQVAALGVMEVGDELQADTSELFDLVVVIHNGRAIVTVAHQEVSLFPDEQVGMTDPPVLAPVREVEPVEVGEDAFHGSSNAWGETARQRISLLVIFHPGKNAASLRPEGRTGA